MIQKEHVQILLSVHAKTRNARTIEFVVPASTVIGQKIICPVASGRNKKRYTHCRNTIEKTVIISAGKKLLHLLIACGTIPFVRFKSKEVKNNERRNTP